MSTKKELYQLVSEGVESTELSQDSDMYYALYAYETYGNATRDNSFQELVELGKELENEES